jgi:S-adenosylmethionine:tRNA ribosyltransferase-isomerase
MSGPHASGTLGFPEIPENLIAQSPLDKRDHARLMVVDRSKNEFHHKTFFQLEEYFSAGDVLVLNDVKVFPARLTGRKATGGRVKALLLKCLGPAPQGMEKWLSLLTPSLPAGKVISFADDVSAEVLGQRPSGENELSFSRSIKDELPRLGKMPLPPYIHRPDSAEAEDRVFYQTVYARDSRPAENDAPWTPGAVAAPTAGLHFTEDLLKKIQAKGVDIVHITLKVGWGTFRPLRDPDHTKHRMLPEEYTVTDAAAKTINERREKGGRVWAVGTTAVRTLESVSDDHGRVRPGTGETSLYIYPGHKFRAVDVLVTNFHLPGHTPLLLAAAFAGEELLKHSYIAAIAEGYRFFSYGDGMVVL